MSNCTVSTRAQSSYQTLSQRFDTIPPSLTLPHTQTATNTNPYNRQYSNVYRGRLSMLRDRCLSSADSSSSSNTTITKTPKIVPRIIELMEDEPSTVVGTIIKQPIAPLPTEEGEGGGYHDPPAPPVSKTEDNIEGLFYRTHCREDDALFLEDESGRVELVFPSPPADDNVDDDVGKGGSGGKFAAVVDGGLGLVTGVVAAVMGVVRNGALHVESVHLPEPVPNKDETEEKMEEEKEGAMKDKDNEKETYILLLSGLDCGGPDEDDGTGISHSLRREMLLDYLTGHFASETDEDKSQRISRVLVAGGGLTKPLYRPNDHPYGDWSSNNTDTTTSSTSNNKSKSSSSGTNTRDDGRDSVSFSIQELDLFLSSLLATGLPVDLLPGTHDPTNANWPQRPIHGCLLPRSERFVAAVKGDGDGDLVPLLGRRTNPYEARIGERVVLGTDGRNVADLRKYLARRRKTNKEDDGSGGGGEGDGEGDITVKKENDQEKLEGVTALGALHSSLLFHHVAPTAPDTLPSFPFDDTDPFVMEQTPEVYFVGNCDTFETDLIRHEGGGMTRLVCVPSFVPTGQAVLLNLKTLGCELLEFDDDVMIGEGDEEGEDAMEE